MKLLTLFIFLFSSQAPAERLACSSALISSSESTVASIEAAKKVIELIFKSLSELGSSSSSHLNGTRIGIEWLSRLSSQSRATRILQNLRAWSLGETLVDLVPLSAQLTALDLSPTVSQLFDQLPDTAWATIREYAKFLLAQKNDLSRGQKFALEKSSDDFKELPDVLGEVELHRMIRRLEFDKVHLFLQNKKLSRRYLNMINKSAQTPLDLLRQLCALHTHSPADNLEPWIRLTKQMTGLGATTADEMNKLLNLFKFLVVQHKKFDSQTFLLKFNQRESPFLPLISDIGQGHEAWLFFDPAKSVLELVKRFLFLGLDPDGLSAEDKPENMPLLHYAASKNSGDFVEALILSFFNVNQTDPFGRTPLHIAAIFGSLDVIKVLAAHRANPNALDNPDLNAYQYAVNFFNVDTMYALVKAGARVELPNYFDKRNWPALSNVSPAVFKETLEQIYHNQAKIRAEGFHGKKNQQGDQW